MAHASPSLNDGIDNWLILTILTFDALYLDCFIIKARHDGEGTLAVLSFPAALYVLELVTFVGDWKNLRGSLPSGTPLSSAYTLPARPLAVATDKSLSRLREI